MFHHFQHILTEPLSFKFFVLDFIAPMPDAHAGSSLVILDYNTLFLAGGYGGALGYTNKTYILNRGDNIWNMMADMPTARSV